MGKVYLNNGDYNLARDYLNQSVAIFKEMGYSHQLDECYKNIGQTYLAENNLQKARENFQMALEISTKEEDLPGIAEAYIKLAQIKFIDQDIKSAT
jgi:tetratricopeptide (TPR) repeat protein